MALGLFALVTIVNQGCDISPVPTPIPGSEESRFGETGSDFDFEPMGADEPSANQAESGAGFGSGEGTSARNEGEEGSEDNGGEVDETEESPSSEGGEGIGGEEGGGEEGGETLDQADTSETEDDACGGFDEEDAFDEMDAGSLEESDSYEEDSGCQ